GWRGAFRIARRGFPARRVAQPAASGLAWRPACTGRRALAAGGQSQASPWPGQSPRIRLRGLAVGQTHRCDGFGQGGRAPSGYPRPERLARQLAPTSAGDAGFRTRRWTGRFGAGRWFWVDAYRLGPATRHRHGAFDGDLRPAYWPAGDAGLRPGCWACAQGALAASAALAAVGVRPGPG